MRIYEITNPEDQLALLKMIIDNTWAAISREQQTKKPLVKATPATPLKKGVKPKAIPKPKKAPYAATPKPLAKPNPVYQTPTQIHHQQLKTKQGYAQEVEGTFNKDAVKMPKSLQPLPGNIISPIGGVDPDFEKKMQDARNQGEQNRANGSLPLSN
ncbi:hypothetical protein ICU98_06875 [Polynucleobacter sp. MWH-P3-07-1]|uniref:hypothetical protein n=1 Tax=Polynucleobacter sp. MWH-P3-07-1 TaxID=1743173 RepID=UPI001BFE6D63|nr:hypothetical protein [Polynucleobacter sp. MWH-P3-07-1]QWD83152.1 hypothetical protein ICU98_06875 [Polynucleobacter sp. MWH-P3-07-1]